MTIRRKWYMDAWKACADAIHEVIPDASVSICDIGEGSIIPDWVPSFGDDFDISSDTLKWIKVSLPHLRVDAQRKFSCCYPFVA